MTESSRWKYCASGLNSPFIVLAFHLWYGMWAKKKDYSTLMT